MLQIDLDKGYRTAPLIATLGRKLGIVQSINDSIEWDEMPKWTLI